MLSWKKDKAINETDLFRWTLVFTLANVYNLVNDKYRLHDNALTRVLITTVDKFVNENSRQFPFDTY